MSLSQQEIEIGIDLTVTGGYYLKHCITYFMYTIVLHSLAR